MMMLAQKDFEQADQAMDQAQAKILQERAMKTMDEAHKLLSKKPGLWPVISKLFKGKGGGASIPGLAGATAQQAAPATAEAAGQQPAPAVSGSAGQQAAPASASAQVTPEMSEAQRTLSSALGINVQGGPAAISPQDRAQAAGTMGITRLSGSPLDSRYVYEDIANTLGLRRDEKGQLWLGNEQISRQQYKTMQEIVAHTANQVIGASREEQIKAQADLDKKMVSVNYIKQAEAAGKIDPATASVLVFKIMTGQDPLGYEGYMQIETYNDRGEPVTRYVKMNRITGESQILLETGRQMSEFDVRVAALVKQGMTPSQAIAKIGEEALADDKVKRDAQRARIELDRMQVKMQEIARPYMERIQYNPDRENILAALNVAFQLLRSTDAVQSMEPGNVTKVLFSTMNDYFGISPDKIVSVLGVDLQAFTAEVWRQLDELKKRKQAQEASQNQGASGPPSEGPPEQNAGETGSTAPPKGFGWPTLFGKPAYQYIPHFWITGKVPWRKNE